MRTFQQTRPVPADEFRISPIVFKIPHLALTVAGVVSFAICLCIVLTKGWHGVHTLDSDDGVQKIHAEPTPRIGGIAIYVGMLAGWWLAPPEIAVLLGPMLIAVAPAFIAGVLEDVTKRDSVRERLLATFASGLLAWWLTGISLNHIHLWGVDYLLGFVPISVLFTAFALAGVANAVNIIDGLNGLASGTVLLCLTALGLIALLAGDAEMAKVCFVLGGATCGFMVVNYHGGKIFLGDGGAYLLGFLLGWVAVMVAVRNPTTSAWAPLLACGYPILEVLFSIARRHARTLHVGHPDRLHLHSLLWARVARKAFRGRSAMVQNAAVLPMILLYSLIPVVLAITFRRNTAALIAGFLACGYLYALIYSRLVHFSWTWPKLRPARQGTSV